MPVYNLPSGFFQSPPTTGGEQSQAALQGLLQELKLKQLDEKKRLADFDQAVKLATAKAKIEQKSKEQELSNMLKMANQLNNQTTGSVEGSVSNNQNVSSLGGKFSTGEQIQAINTQQKPFLFDPLSKRMVSNPEYESSLDRVKRQKMELEIQEAEREEGEAQQAKQTQVDNLISSAQDTVRTIGVIKKNLRYFGPSSVIPPFPGEFDKINWKANLDKLRSTLVLDIMTSLKKASKTGATGFGQLSNKELQLLQNAATALKEGMNEEEALKLLNQIEGKAQKILHGVHLKKNNFNVRLNDGSTIEVERVP